MEERMEPKPSFQFISKHTDTTHMYPTNIYWREKYVQLTQNKRIWVDKPLRKRDLALIEHLPKKDDFLRFVVCGVRGSNKHRVVHKIATMFNAKDHILVDQEGMVEIVTITVSKNCPKVVLYVSDDPHRYLLYHDGTSFVDGVVYVTNPETFPSDYKLIYRHFHDIIGEYKAVTLHCMVIAYDAENYDLVSHVNFHTNTVYLFSDQVVNTAADAVQIALRCNDLYTCHW